MSGEPIDLLLSRLKGAKQNGSPHSWTALCPAHDDRHPSLSITNTDDGTVLLKCHADSRCTTEAIVDALGLEMRNLFPNKNGSGSGPGNGKSKVSGKSKLYRTDNEAIKALEAQHGRRSKLWTYFDADGQPVGLIVRWDTHERKIIRPVSRLGDGWHQCGMPPPRPLYGLPNLLAPSSWACVDEFCVGEGEKCAQALGRLGFLATTSAHGAKSAAKTDWSPLAGRDVAIFPDNDDAGRKYAEDVATILTHLSPPA